MVCDTIRKLSYENLNHYTDNFCERNYLGHFQFGRLYRAIIKWIDGPQHFVVKVWEIPEKYDYSPGDNELRFADEIILLRHQVLISHPGMIKLYGFCSDGVHLAVMYELKASDSVYNLIPMDGFTWLQRIKVAIGFASLLKFLHVTGNSINKPFIIRNLDAAHILLDENGYPRLCDFGMVTGGIFPDRTVYKDCRILGCYGYIDSCIGRKGNWSDKQDVFAFGVILLGLITKRVYTEEDRQARVPCVREWVQREYADNKLLVHDSLALDPDFLPADGAEITALAMQCVNAFDNERPTMKQVLKSLFKLEAAKQHADFLGISKVPQL